MIGAIILLILGSICTITSMRSGQKAADSGNIAGVLWHGAFVLVGASAVHIGLIGLGFA